VLAAGPFTEEGDYDVAFEVECRESRPRSAEQWARAIFEDAPRVTRWFLIAGWTAITCRLHPRRSESRVLGWQIDTASNDMAVMAVHARVGLTSHLVVSVDADRVTLASFVRYTGSARPVARAVWAGTVPLHERILPHLLTMAARHHENE
jgi:hypothetical protein